MDRNFNFQQATGVNINVPIYRLIVATMMQTKHLLEVRECDNTEKTKLLHWAHLCIW